MPAFVPPTPSLLGSGSFTHTRVPAPRSQQTSVRLPRTARRTSPARHVPVMAAPQVDDKAVVTEYFNNKGFDRWNRIYSDDGEVNSVQLDIREGHAKTVEKILAWVDADADADGKTFCDAGCGVGSLTIPLLQRGARVAASDISAAMVEEAQRRASETVPESLSNASFTTSDLESVSGSYDTVCCVDVMIHYPTDKAAEMISKLASRADRRLIISFAPKTFLLSILKKVGDFFPGPSKATRAYLHAEEDVVKAIEAAGFKVKRSDLTSTRFYFSKLLEAVKE